MKENGESDKIEIKKIIGNKRLKIIIIVLIIISTIGIFGIISSRNKDVSKENNTIEVGLPIKKEISDWRLKLVNKENPLPQDYEIELSNIDEIRQFDKRAIGELKKMLEDMNLQGVQNIWVQSAYRSIEYQQVLYNNSINKYLNQGKSSSEAEELTLEYINKPGESEHNLGLAVDFNDVDEGFEHTKAYEWLKENAKNYGFVLRYPEEKSNITLIEYEPWHWRYVGKENAIKMNDLNMCLEEYIEYLESENLSI